MNRANKKGYIRTILGRRARFDFWTNDFSNTPVKITPKLSILMVNCSERSAQKH
jgi:hypothetical protein